MPSFRTAVMQLVREGKDIPMRQCAVLMAVRDPGELPSVGVRELAKLMNVHKPVVTRACDVLVKIDWLRRAPDPKDARLVVLSLTAAGKKAADRLLAA